MPIPVNNGSAADQSYAQWVGQKNKWGAGGMAADQLGYDKYLQETAPDEWTARLAAQQAVSPGDNSYAANMNRQMGAAGNASNTNTWIGDNGQTYTRGAGGAITSSPLAGLQAAAPPVTPQGTAAVATAGASPVPLAPATPGARPLADPADPSGGTGFVPPGIPPVQPAKAAEPVLPPAAPVNRPRRRTVTQSSRPLQGLRAANGAGY